VKADKYVKMSETSEAQHHHHQQQQHVVTVISGVQN